MCWCRAGQINKALKHLKKDWLPSLVQLLVLGHTGATGQRAQYGKSGKSTGEHWQALATIGLGRAGAAELLGEAGAGQGTARSDR